MKFVISTFLSILLFFLFLVLSCGHKIDKASLDADAYFEYAKKLFDEGKYLQATTEFSVIVLKFSGSPVVDDAQFYLAESHFQNEEYLIAVAEYQKLVEDYPESPYVEEAFYKIGVSYAEQSQRPELDQEYTQQALRHLQNFIEAYPKGEFRQKADDLLNKLRTKLARKQLMNANTYRKMGLYDSAVIYYDIILEKYYDTPAAEPALYWKAESQYKMDNYQDALTNFTVFIEKFPASERVSNAKSRISELQELISEEQSSLTNN